MPKYDIAVIGAGLGGLTTAALLAKKRKKVVLLDPADQVGGELSDVQRKEFRFLTGPNLSLGFERGGALQELCADLGIAHSTSVISPCYQVVLPDRRINIYPEHSETLEELRREFPREIDRLSRFFRDIRKVSEQMSKSRLYALLARNRHAGGFLGRYGFSSELTAFFQVPALYFLHQPAERASLASLATLFDAAPQFIHGGLKGLADQILDFILKNGGEVRYSEPWPELVLSRRGGVGLKTREGEVGPLPVLFNTRQVDQGSALFLGLKDEVIPAGMHREILCLADYARPRDFFSLSLSARDDETQAPRGMRALTAMFPSVPLEQGITERLVKQVGWVIPFLKPNIVLAELHIPVPRTYAISTHAPFKKMKSVRGAPILRRAASQELYEIPDGGGSPLEAVKAARRLAETLA